MYRRRTGRKRRRRPFRRGYDRRRIGLYGRFRRKRRRLTEKKFLDLILTDALISTAGTGFAVTAAQPNTDTATIVGILQGNGAGQRIGRKCTITNILCRFLFAFDDGTPDADLAAADGSNDCLRIIIFWDKQCNGTSATATQMLETDAFNAFRSITNASRFNILYDKLFTLNSNAIAAGNGTNDTSRVVHKNFIKKVNIKCFIPMEFSGTTGNLTEMRTNNVGILAWSQSNRMTLETTILRIRFVDY